MTGDMGRICYWKIRGIMIVNVNNWK
jgi:hypothetical protein